MAVYDSWRRKGEIFLFIIYVAVMPEWFISFFALHAREIGVIAGIYFVGRIGMRILKSIFLKRCAKGASAGQVKRLKTIARLLNVVLHAVLLVMIGMWVLRIFGVDPTPLFASAGVVGLAIGFGAQTLVKDFLSGMFIIVENQYGVGDWVRINGQEGEVKILSIRHTLLHDKDGNAIYIPNGTISLVVNLKHPPIDKAAQDEK